MENLIDTINEIITTAENADLPYVKHLGEKAKKQFINEFIIRNRNANRPT